MVKKGDLIELSYTGYLEDGSVFDTTDSALSKKASNVIIKVGNGELVKGLDVALQDKEVGKEYSVKILPEDGFGLRNPKLVRVFPLNEFKKHKLQPFPGLQVEIDGSMATVKSVNGGRVRVDFNHPLCDHTLTYSFKIINVFQNDVDKVKAIIQKYKLNAEVSEDGKVLKLNSPMSNGTDSNQSKALVKYLKDLFKNYLDLDIDIEFIDTKNTKENKNNQN